MRSVRLELGSVDSFDESRSLVDKRMGQGCEIVMEL